MWRKTIVDAYQADELLNSARIEQPDWDVRYVTGIGDGKVLILFWDYGV